MCYEKMNCLMLLHAYNAHVQAIEQGHDAVGSYRRELSKVEQLFEERHEGIPSWDEAAECNH